MPRTAHRILGDFNERSRFTCEGCDRSLPPSSYPRDETVSFRDCCPELTNESRSLDKYDVDIISIPKLCRECKGERSRLLKREKQLAAELEEVRLRLGRADDDL
ncbi:hypothetical protein SEA_HEXBUG_50 [Gordonia phage Hexbug]|nr:hypothetical protein SEA_ORLA_50 [Gordonia phage Orla]UVK62964.1 hypothetical protein SEA_HEXBUG_50 [Gordonia phage Hexbug]